MTRLRNVLSRLRKREDGNASIEFVLMFPLFMALFFSAFELAIIMTRHALLERAVDVTVRDLRLGRIPDVTHDGLKEIICEEAGVIPNCESELLLELQPIQAPSYTMPDPNAKCIDRDAAVQPIVTFRDGPENEMMLLRACAMVDPFFPGTSLALKLEEKAGDGFGLVVTSAYVNEPGAGS